MNDRVDQSDWERQRESLEWPDGYGGELEGLHLGGIVDKTWKERYIAHLVKAGVEQGFAEATYEAGIPHDQTCDPEEAADIEMSYWGNDD